MNRNFDVGIIGLGRIGGVHLDAWRSVPDARVTAVCDANHEARQKATSQGMTAFETPEQMLARMKLDAVSICAPPDRHRPLAQICFNAGVAVLCEKPLADTVQSAVALVDDAGRTGGVFQMATKFRHAADLIAARSLMRQGVIGDPLTFRVEFSGPVDMSERWNSDPVVSGGGVLIDNGSHAVDLTRFLFSRIARVMAVNLKPVQKLPVEDSALILVSTDCGVTGKILLSWSMKPSADNYVIIQGTKGQIDIGWKESYLKLDGKPPEKIGSGYDKHASHARMMTMFRDYALGRGDGWITAEEALASAMVTDAAYESINSARWVDIAQAAVPAGRRGVEADRPARALKVAAG